MNKVSISELLPRIKKLSATKQAILLQSIKTELNAADERQVIPRFPQKEFYPLSYAQQRMWFTEQLAPGNPIYNNPVAARMKGSFDQEVFREALSEIVIRHESLRTTFVAIEGQPFQVISNPRALNLTEVDLRGGSEVEIRDETNRLMRMEAERPFDLTKDLLLRGSILRVSDDDFVVLLTMHHISSDPWSKGILIREISTIYDAIITGRKPPLCELPIQYRDFAQWQRQWLASASAEKQLAYWKRNLAGSQSLSPLQTDYPRPSDQKFTGATLPLAINADLSAALRNLSRQREATLFMTLLAAFDVLLYCKTRCRDLIIGTDVANRDHPETDGIIGLFVNQVVLRIDMSSVRTFADLLAAAQEQSLNAFSNKDLPFDTVVEALKAERSLSYHVLFQVMFGLQNAPMPHLSLPGLNLEILPTDNGTSIFDMTLFLKNTEPELTGFLRFKDSLFKSATIRAMREQYLIILSAIANNPHIRIDELELTLSKYDAEQRAHAEQEMEDYSLDQLARSRRREIKWK
jgi:hypothetical protein